MKFYDNDLTKSVLQLSWGEIRTRLSEVRTIPPLPERYDSHHSYYEAFLPFLLEEARAIIKDGFKRIIHKDVKYQETEQKEKESVHDGQFSLVVREEPRIPKRDSNPVMVFCNGSIPPKIEHSRSVDVLLIRFPGVAEDFKSFWKRSKRMPLSHDLYEDEFNVENAHDDKQLLYKLAVASLRREQGEAGEEGYQGTAIKMMLSQELYQRNRDLFKKNAVWQVYYVGSLVSEDRIRHACLEKKVSLCLRQIISANILEPNTQKITERYQPFLKALNSSQRRAVNAFLASPKGTVTLLQGPPGTGKTTTLVELLNVLSFKRKRVLVRGAASA